MNEYSLSDFWEMAKRRIGVALIVALIVTGVFAVKTLLTTTVISPSYTSSAAFYVETSSVISGENGDPLIYSDSKRIDIARASVLSATLKEQVAKDIGVEPSEFSIENPVPIDPTTNKEFSIPYVYIAVTASDKDIAYRGAQSALKYVTQSLKKIADVPQIRIYQEPTQPKFTEEDATQPTGISALPKKKLVVLFVAITVLMLLGFAVYEVVSRKIYSAASARNMFGIPLLMSAKTSKSGTLSAIDAKMLAELLRLRYPTARRVAFVGISPKDAPAPKTCADALNAAEEACGAQTVAAADVQAIVVDALGTKPEGIKHAASADLTVVVTKSGKAQRKEIERSAQLIAELPQACCCVLR